LRTRAELKRNRERYLMNRAPKALIKSFSGVVEGWLEAETKFARLGGIGPRRQDLRETLARGLEIFSRQLRVKNLPHVC